MRVGLIPTINKEFLLHTREWERTARLGLEHVYSHYDLVWFRIILYIITHVNIWSGISYFEHLFKVYFLRHYPIRIYGLWHKCIMGFDFLTILFLLLFGSYSISLWLMPARVIICLWILVLQVSCGVILCKPPLAIYLLKPKH